VARPFAGRPCGVVGRATAPAVAATRQCGRHGKGRPHCGSHWRSVHRLGYRAPTRVRSGRNQVPLSTCETSSEAASWLVDRSQCCAGQSSARSSSAAVIANGPGAAARCVARRRPPLAPGRLWIGLWTRQWTTVASWGQRCSFCGRSHALDGTAKLIAISSCAAGAHAVQISRRRQRHRSGGGSGGWGRPGNRWLR
jgi:hypothetical protein